MTGHRSEVAMRNMAGGMKAEQVSVASEFGAVDADFARPVTRESCDSTRLAAHLEAVKRACAEEKRSSLDQYLSAEDFGDGFGR